MLGNFRESAIEGAAAGFDQLTRGATHALHLFGIFQQVDHFDAGVFGTFDLDGSAGFDEARSHSGKILHGRAEDGNFAEGCRFENVVPAGVDERAANKNAVGEAVEGGEFADGVEQENSGVVGDAIFAAVGVGRDAGAWQGEFGAANEFAMRLFDEFSRGAEAFGLARREDEQGFREISLDDTEGDEGERFFGCYNAAGNDERVAAATLAFLFEPLRERSGRGEFEIVFEIAANGDAIRGSAEGADAFGVLFRLHEEGGGVGQRGFQK